MLRHLTIRDFVLVDRLELDFSGGFGALTGETGAGKSLLVDALSFALGERADSGLVRDGAERAEVAAEFDIAALPELAAWLRELDCDGEGDTLLLRRVLDASGRSRAYLNGAPATLQQLRAAAEWLVDIHGQHAHQSLLRAEAQRRLLDDQAGLGDLARRVAVAWRAWREAADRLRAARENGDALAREREELEWQAGELESLAFSPQEWQEINQEHRRLGHAAGLIEGAAAALDLIAEGEGAVLAQVGAAQSRLESLAEYDPALREIADLIASAEVELQEAGSALRRYADRLDLDPQRLAEVERRLEAVHGMARKFRVTPEELPGLAARVASRLAELGESADLDALAQSVEALSGDYRKLAGELSAGRSRAAKKLGTEVSRAMQDLALAGGRFEAALLPLAEPGAHGLEQIEFRIAGLAGGEARPLARVASGGELSRISLAIQVVTSSAARVPTLVFDEVDVGIGGGVAEVVGKLLARLGEGRQVLCVTHLPQVAAEADWQWSVAKKKDGGAGFVSEVHILDEAGRVEEIARMLGGVKITETTRRHAREMLGLTA